MFFSHQQHTSNKQRFQALHNARLHLLIVQVFKSIAGQDEAQLDGRHFNFIQPIIGHLKWLLVLDYFAPSQVVKSLWTHAAYLPFGLHHEIPILVMEAHSFFKVVEIIFNKSSGPAAEIKNSLGLVTIEMAFMDLDLQNLLLHMLREPFQIQFVKICYKYSSSVINALLICVETSLMLPHVDLLHIIDPIHWFHQFLSQTKAAGFYFFFLIILLPLLNQACYFLPLHRFKSFLLQSPHLFCFTNIWILFTLGGSNFVEISFCILLCIWEFEARGLRLEILHGILTAVKEIVDVIVADSVIIKNVDGDISSGLWIFFKNFSIIEIYTYRNTFI